MRRFRRKRRGGIWLPIIGNGTNGEVDTLVIGAQGNITVDPAGTIDFDAFPVTFDTTTSSWAVQAGAEGTLHDIVSGQAWRLRRIVGKAHITAFSKTGGTELGSLCPAVEVAAGYIVCRTDELNNANTNFEQTNPLVQESAEDPWIWRRKWILSNAALKNGLSTVPSYADPLVQSWFDAGRMWPANTENCGSVADGPHIDQKTARVISREERLFMVIATRIWQPIPGVIAPTEPLKVYYNIDHRFFGSLFSQAGNRRNASR